MILRCTSCQSAVAVPCEGREPRVETVCKRCSQRYQLDGSRLRGTALRRLGERARRLTAEHGIDLPAANSIELGLIELDRVLEVVESARETAPRLEAPDAAAPAVPVEYDPAFAPAVQAGRLTVSQAVARGQRAAYCERLRARHGLSARQAEAVADNRRSLIQALRARDASTARPVRVQRGSLGTSLAAIVGLTALVALGAAGAFLAPSEETVYEAAAEVPRGDASYIVDHAGRVLRVQGPDPGSVLRTFCVVGAERGRYEPASIVPIESATGRARLGLLRDPAAPDELLAITIREDRDAGSWISDNAGRPLVAGPAPDGASRRVRTVTREKVGGNSSAATAAGPENKENKADSGAGGTSRH